MTQQEWYDSIEMVGVVAGCLLKQNDTYLLVQEAQEAAYGLWNLPAGHVDKGEGLEAAAIREVKEETGYEVKLIREIALIHETAAQSIKHIYLAEIIGGKLVPQEGELLDAKWLSFDEIMSLNENSKLRKPWVWNIIRHDTESTLLK